MKKSILTALGFLFVLAFRSPYCGLDVTGTSSMIMPNSYGGIFLSLSNYSFAEIIQSPESINGHMEMGWLLLSKAISHITGDLQIYLMIISILQIIPVAYIIGKYSNNVVLSFFVFACLGFYIHYFSGIRQMFAVSLILLAFDQLYQKRYVLFVAIVLLASSIHSSSLFFLIMLKLSNFKLTFVKTLIGILIIFFTLPFYTVILSRVLDSFFDSRYEGYLKSEGSAMTMFIVYAFILLLSFLYKQDNKRIRSLRMTLLFGVACQSLGVLGNSAITRIGFYFNIMLILIIPDIVLSFKFRNVRNMLFFIAVVLLCIFFVLTNNENSTSGVFPYDFFWNRPAMY